MKQWLCVSDYPIPQLQHTLQPNWNLIAVMCTNDEYFVSIPVNVTSLFKVQTKSWGVVPFPSICRREDQYDIGIECVYVYLFIQENFPFEINSIMESRAYKHVHPLLCFPKWLWRENTCWYLYTNICESNQSMWVGLSIYACVCGFKGWKEGENEV